MEKIAQVLGDVVQYIQSSEYTREKQANEIEYYKNKDRKLFEKVSAIVDSCVETGKVPAYLANSLKQDLHQNPEKIAELFVSDYDLRDPIGESHPGIGDNSFSDDVERFCYNENI